MFKEKSTYVHAPLVAGLLIPLFASFVAKLNVGEESVGNILLGFWRSFVESPLGSIGGGIWSFLPFVALSIFCGVKAKKWALEMLVFVSVPGLLALLIVYLLAFVEYEQYMANRMWTASTFTFAFLPFKALFWMSIGMWLGWITIKQPKQHEA